MLIYEILQLLFCKLLREGPPPLFREARQASKTLASTRHGSTCELSPSTPGTSDGAGWETGGHWSGPTATEPAGSSQMRLPGQARRLFPQSPGSARAAWEVRAAWAPEKGQKLAVAVLITAFVVISSSCGRRAGSEASKGEPLYMYMFFALSILS